MATQDVEILQVDTSQSMQSVASLRKEIKGLKDQLLNLEQGTKEYNDTLVELGNKTHELREIQQQVRQTTTDFGDSLSNLRGTITGVTGAFQTVLGSLSLLGVNLGDDVKMLKMLQSAMAITQGVSAIDAGVKSFKALTISIKASTAAMSGLKKALLSSGIGAIILLVGALASGLIDMGNDAEISTDKEIAFVFKLLLEKSGSSGCFKIITRIRRDQFVYKREENSLNHRNISGNVVEHPVKSKQDRHLDDELDAAAGSRYAVLAIYFLDLSLLSLH